MPRTRPEFISRTTPGASAASFMANPLSRQIVLPVFFIAVALLVVSGPAFGQQPAATDESFFAATLYPVLHAAQCVRCHSDNGVASETALEFPREGASQAQITLFGLTLLDLVDRDRPAQSLLFVKPTKRVKHTGGQRIK